MTEAENPDEVISQVRWLQHDVLIYRDLMLERKDLLSPLADLRNKDRQNLYSVVADLYWLAIHHALGVVQLLEQELRAPLVVVQRALYETVVSLRYLTSRPDPVHEALIYRAYSFLQEIKFFPDDDGLVLDRTRILSEMPAGAVEMAEARVGQRRGWSGKNMRAMSEAAGFDGYELYGWLSEEGHSRVVGQHVRVERTDGEIGVLRFGRPVEDPERQNMANFARRMLNYAFTSFWSEFEGGPASIQTSDPHAWLSSGERK